MPMSVLMGDRARQPWTLVREFLARGRPARLVACVIVALAAVVWIAVASLVLRVAFAAVLLLLVVWCAWLVVGIWRGEDAGSWRTVLPSVPWRLTRATPAHATARPERSTTAAEDLHRRERELAEREAALAAVTSSLNAVIADLLRGQERLHADAEQLQRELAGQTEAMNAVVAKLAQTETRTRRSDDVPSPYAPEPVTTADERSAVDLHTARLELEADLRMEEIEQQEERLRAYEEQLRRREAQLANFVAQTQGQLRPA